MKIYLPSIANSKATNKIEKLIYNIIRQNNKFIMLTIVKKKISGLTILVLHALIREPPRINLKKKHNSINKDGKRCRFLFLGIEISLLVEVQYTAAIFGLKRHSYI